MSENEKTPETDDSTARVIKAGISPIIDYCYALDMRKMEIERNEARAQAVIFRDAHGENPLNEQALEVLSGIKHLIQTYELDEIIALIDETLNNSDHDE